METLKITVNDKDQAQLLARLVEQLTFVTTVELIEDKPTPPRANFASEAEFLAMSGLWKDRDVTAEKIREQAWRNIKR